MTNPLLEIRNLTKSYDGIHNAVDNLSCELKKNEFLVLLGLSGCGKSTLLRCINRLVEPEEGQIFFEGNEILGLKGKDLKEYRKQVGMIFQQFNLVKNLSVLTNVLTGRLGYHRIGASFTADEIALAHRNLEKVGLKCQAKKQVKHLSGGQQQRVAIARTLMQKPKLILADEPIASLDPATADSIMQYLAEINNEGITVICSLHFLSLVRKYGDRVLALKDGKKIFEGQPGEIDKTWFREIYGEEAVEI